METPAKQDTADQADKQEAQDQGAATAQTENVEAPAAEGVDPASFPADPPALKAQGETVTLKAQVEAPQLRPVTAPPVAPAQRETPPAPRPRVAAVIGKVTPVAVSQTKKKSDFEETIEKLLARTDITVEERNLIINLREYARKMNPLAPITPTDGVKEQQFLQKVLFSVIKDSSNNSFRRLWSIVLGFFNDGRLQKETNAFYMPHVFRFFDQDHWTISENRIKVFQDLLDLVIQTSNPENRAEKYRMVDIEKTLSASEFTPEQRERVVTFYTT